MADLPLILVINLAREVARWQQISAALRALDLPYTRIRAIDARRHMDLVRTRLPRPYASATLGRDLTPAECCCALSHLAALKAVLRQPVPAAIILEDDVEIDHRFKRFVTGALWECVAHADIIKFEGLEYPYTSITGPCLAAHALGTVIVPLHPTLGAAAYAVTQAGARRLLAAGAALSEPFDHVLAYYERHHIPYAETRPFVVRQGAFPSQVTATLQGLPETPAAPAPLTMRIRQHCVYRGSVRLVLATAWVTRARLWPRRPAAYRLGRQWQRALLAARWVLRARLRRLFR